VAQNALQSGARIQNPMPTRDQVDAVREQIPEEVRAQAACSSAAAMARNFRGLKQNARMEQGDHLLDVQNPLDIVIPDRLHDLVIFEGIVENKKIIVFLSNLGRQILETYGSHLCMDGTFKVCILIKSR
jgi:hypothetical protein